MVKVPGADGVGIGTGQQNTTDILNFIKKKGWTSHVLSAASIADNYSRTVDGTTYDDWFLPSIGELREMAKIKDLLEFSLQGYYSSTEASDTHAWLYFFHLIDVNSGSKTHGALSWFKETSPGNIDMRVVREF